MRSQIAVVLIAATLFIGVAIGYFGSTSFRSGLETCTVTQYAVWSVESVIGNTTVGGTSTASHVAATFETSGYPSSTTNTYTGTLTGAIESWNGTTCR